MYDHGDYNSSFALRAVELKMLYSYISGPLFFGIFQIFKMGVLL